jgi:hypothetical protein
MPSPTVVLCLTDLPLVPPRGRARAPARRDDVRLQLSGRSDAWVAIADVTALPTGSALGPATVGSITATPGMDRVTLRIPVGWRVPFQVEERDDGVTIALYSAVGDLNWIRHGETRGMLRHLLAPAQSDGRSPGAHRPLWGYQPAGPRRLLRSALARSTPRVRSGG